MRIIVFFDIPVKTPIQRKLAVQFRNYLLNDGFIMLQYSVYSRIIKGESSAIKHTQKIHENTRRIQQEAPVDSNIRVLTITEKQYGSMLFITGDKKPEEKRLTYEQLLLL